MLHHFVFIVSMARALKNYSTLSHRSFYSSVERRFYTLNSYYQTKRDLPTNELITTVIVSTQHNILSVLDLAIAVHLISDGVESSA